MNALNDDQRREWITYRRYSEFNDLHLTIKKRFPALKEFIHLPNKSFMNNTSQEVRVKRQKELNDYLVVRPILICICWFSLSLFLCKRHWLNQKLSNTIQVLANFYWNSFEINSGNTSKQN